MSSDFTSSSTDAVNLECFSRDDPSILRSFAESIWKHAYHEIVSEDQILYMLNRGYSPENIRTEIDNLGIEYLWIRSREENVGFLAVEKELENGTAFLHKFYVTIDAQGKGIASAAMEKLRIRLQNFRVSALRLRVNRSNERAVQFYKRFGFAVTGKDVLPIGNGFVMDDFLMELSLH